MGSDYRRTWAQVTQVDPLRIQLEHDSAPMEGTPDTLVAGLEVGDQVRVVILDGQAEVVGKPRAALASNPNLIINGDLRINQRGAVSGASVTAGNYFVDRFRAGSAGAFTWSDSGGVRTVTIPSGATMETELEATNLPAGEYTLSWPGTSQAALYNSNDTEPSLADSPVTVTLDGTNDVTAVFGPGTVEQVKLERGTVATPFQTTDHGEELAKCQRYYFRASGTGASQLASGTADGTTSARVATSLPVTMRAAPTVSSGGSLRLYEGTGGVISVTSLSSTGLNGPSTGAFVASVASGLTQYRFYMLIQNSDADAYIAFDAEM